MNSKSNTFNSCAPEVGNLVPVSFSAMCDKKPPALAVFPELVNQIVPALEIHVRHVNLPVGLKQGQNSRGIKITMDFGELFRFVTRLTIHITGNLSDKDDLASMLLEFLQHGQCRRTDGNQAGNEQHLISALAETELMVVQPGNRTL